MDFERILKQIEELLTKSKAEYSAGQIPKVQEHLIDMLFFLIDELVEDAPGNPDKPLPERSKS